MDAITMGDELVLRLRSTNFDFLGFDDREKTTILNQAQDDFTKERAIADLNVKRKGFEVDAKRRLDLSGIITSHVQYTQSDFMLGTKDNGAKRTPDRDFQSESVAAGTGDYVESNYGIFCEVPDECLFIISEYCDTSKGTEKKYDVPVESVRYEEYQNGIRNRYKQPFFNKVWRLDWGSYTAAGTGGTVASSKFTGSTLTGFTGVRVSDGGAMNITTYRSVMLIPGKDWAIEAYTMHYIKRPSRILVDSITPANQRNCELHPGVHDEIVEKAVRIAISSKLPEQAKYQIASKEEVENV